ncbi:hypothetical protein J2W57_001765 [Chryseobacterium ginsenosidimutans]|uniref:Uncharacterized protein n=1 Tax=Chryseobacterium geocarposphaerae TaxID=1416776 RepID=A0ABU1LBK4_9FLAO|nr:hypothetical protein [Chryseobacterium geocarposphaerae]MDR6698393.1 hypothetical protein [Chryseobacterium ginsenosidimutans]
MIPLIITDKVLINVFLSESELRDTIAYFDKFIIHL